MPQLKDWKKAENYGHKGAHIRKESGHHRGSGRRDATTVCKRSAAGGSAQPATWAGKALVRKRKGPGRPIGEARDQETRKASESEEAK